MVTLASICLELIERPGAAPLPRVPEAVVSQARPFVWNWAVPPAGLKRPLGSCFCSLSH